MIHLLMAQIIQDGGQFYLGLGAGGNGIYSIDTTDINNPKHPFAIQNDPSNREISHWNTAGIKRI